MMVGQLFFFLVLTGACQFGHGSGGFTTNFIHLGSGRKCLASGSRRVARARERKVFSIRLIGVPGAFAKVARVTTRRKSQVFVSSNFVTRIVTSVHYGHTGKSRPRRALLCLGRPLAPAAGGAAWPISALAAALAARPTTTTPADQR